MPLPGQDGPCDTGIECGALGEQVWVLSFLLEPGSEHLLLQMFLTGKWKRGKNAATSLTSTALVLKDHFVHMK